MYIENMLYSALFITCCAGAYWLNRRKPLESFIMVTMAAAGTFLLAMVVGGELDKGGYSVTAPFIVLASILLGFGLGGSIAKVMHPQ